MIMFASDSKAVCTHLLNIYKFKIILWGKARPFFIVLQSDVHFYLFGKTKGLRIGTCHLNGEALVLKMP